MSHHEKQLADEAADKALKKAIDKLKSHIRRTGKSDGILRVRCEMEYYRDNPTVIMPVGCENLTRAQVVAAYLHVLDVFSYTKKWKK